MKIEPMGVTTEQAVAAFQALQRGEGDRLSLFELLGEAFVANAMPSIRFLKEVWALVMAGNEVEINAFGAAQRRTLRERGASVIVDGVLTPY